MSADRCGPPGTTSARDGRGRHDREQPAVPTDHGVRARPAVRAGFAVCGGLEVRERLAGRSRPAVGARPLMRAGPTAPSWSAGRMRPGPARGLRCANSPRCAHGPRCGTAHGARTGEVAVRGWPRGARGLGEADGGGNVSRVAGASAGGRRHAGRRPRAIRVAEALDPGNAAHGVFPLRMCGGQRFRWSYGGSPLGYPLVRYRRYRFPARSAHVALIVLHNVRLRGEG